MKALFFLSLFVTVQAIIVSPSNNSQDLSPSASLFRLQAPGPLNGQPLQPLTQTLKRLDNGDKQVCSHSAT